MIDHELEDLSKEENHSSSTDTIVELERLIKEFEEEEEEEKEKVLCDEVSVQQPHEEEDDERRSIR